MSLSVGQVVNGKYRVVRLLGEGGMGCVYEAVHEALGSRVALKSLHPDLSRGGLGPRFLQEARAAARIQSQHVVRVTDVDQAEGGLPFMVLEYIEGKTLQALYDFLSQEGQRLSPGEALEFAMQMFEGVEAAHAAGVVHRDLKPDNVMITVGPKGAPLLKLLDFGIAKLDSPQGATTESRRGLTRPGMIMGTPEYMAPEQAYSADAVDARADVFSLGVILFEMLSGRRPAGGEEPQEIAGAYLTGRIAQLRDLCPDVPPEIAAAVHRAMAPLPKDRFASVREMREVIEPFAPVPPPGTSRAAPSVADAPPGSVAALLSRPDARPIPPTRVHGEPAGDNRPTAAAMAVPLDYPSTPSAAAQAPSHAKAPPTNPTAKSPVYASPGAPPGAPPSVAPVPAYDAWAGSAEPPRAGPSAAPPAPSYVMPLPAEPVFTPPPSLPGMPPGSGYYTRSPSALNSPAQSRSNGGAAVVIVVLVLIAMIGGGAYAAYYYGVFDDAPPSKTTKKPAPKPGPRPTPPPTPTPRKQPGSGNLH